MSSNNVGPSWADAAVILSGVQLPNQVGFADHPQPLNGPFRSICYGAPDMTFLKFTTTACAMVLTLATLPASAGSNRVLIDQWGRDNSGAIAQTGHHQRVSITQRGRGNLSLNTQDGARNRVVVGQSGRDNVADTLQNGRRNIVGVAQMGRQNDATVTQSGNRNAVGVIQTGRGNTANATQAGSGNVVLIIQE
jgi:hypothetical protein